MSEQRPPNFRNGEDSRDLRSIEEARIDAATGQVGGVSDDFAPPTEEERAAAAIHIARAPAERMPDTVRQRLEAVMASRMAQRDESGQIPRLVESAGGVPDVEGTNRRSKPMIWRVVPWVAAAAGIALAVYTGYTGNQALQRRNAEYALLQSKFEEMQARATSNETVLASARSRAAELERELGVAREGMSDRDVRLVEAAKRELEIAERLASVTAQYESAGSRLASVERELNESRLTLARLQAPIDPAELRQNRTKLLDVPDSVQIAWAPFNLPDAPAEQLGVQGDVVWNDRLQTGYLRFVGLNPNDPNIEQYQVWVIDERGLEQKVSGGVFNASADGEIVVPIEPGIAVGRVALFAITVENPGGTWVPDLKRRVVVAPRGE
ncbi:MAG: anti-sigma factor [Phycisphaeraceae bacterium]|nr:anti-sigma factor [Phycisphaeraceae bacterium]